MKNTAYRKALDAEGKRVEFPLPENMHVIDGNHTLDDFLVDAALSPLGIITRWLKPNGDNTMAAYLRAGPLMWSYGRPGQRLPAICIANVNVLQVCQRQGVFSRFVRQLTDSARRFHYQELQLENVLSDEMNQFCRSRGWLLSLRPSTGLPDYFVNL